MYKRWLVLVLIRLLLVIWLQPGYIHPDEFFQTLEIVSGDVYGVDHERTWEYQQQIRSIVPPYLMAGLPMYVHRRLSEVYPSLRSAYLVLVLPRLTMFMSSLAVDYVVYCLSQDYGLDTEIALLLTGTSYLSLVYNTRTLTNALESFFFCLLVVWTFRLKNLQKTKNRLQSKFSYLEMLQKSKDTRNIPKEKANPEGEGRLYHLRDSTKEDNSSDSERDETEASDKFHFVTHTVDSHDKGSLHYKVSLLEVVYVTAIGVICVSGFFNRPTFCAFAAMPLLCWVVTFGKLPDNVQTNLSVVFLLALSTTTLLYITADTLYYNFDTFKILLENRENSYLYSIFDLLRFKVDVALSPYNFVEYNRNPLNLSLHGIHPRFLHFLVNLPLLFGPAFIFLILAMKHCVKFAFAEGFHQLLNIEPNQCKNLSLTLILFLVVPVSSLSLFPHQEPRFLIPVLPLVIVISVHYIADLSCKMRNLFLILWVLFNAILALFYGVYHQGGVIPSLCYIQRNFRTDHLNEVDLGHKSNTSFTFHDRFIYFHTYMPPKHLLLLSNSSNVLTDLKGSSFEKLGDEVNFLYNVDKSGLRNVYVALPGTLIDGLDLRYQTVQILPHHLSTEDFPSFENAFRYLREGNVAKFFTDLDRQMTLHLVRIQSTEGS